MIRSLGLVLMGLLIGASPVPAQEPEAAPLEQFVNRVAHLWEAKDVDRLVDLVSEAEQMVLDRGGGVERVSGRHAAAALRSIFADLESVSVEPAKAAVSGGRPLRGFGELTWVYRARGGPGEQTVSVYVGTIWDGRYWRIGELRIIP